MRAERESLPIARPPQRSRAHRLCAGLGGAGDDHEPRPSSRDADLRRRAPPWPSSPRPGTITIGTKFDQPLFGLKGPDGKPEGFDVEIGKIIAAKLGIARGRHRVGRDRLGQPRAVHRERRGRHRRRDLHDQRQAQGGRLLRRSVLRWPARSILVLADNDDIKSPRTTSSGKTGLLGDRLDARRRTSRSTAPSVLPADTLHRLPRAAAQRPGRRGHHRQRDPGRPRRPERGRVQGRRRALHRGALRHRPGDGRHRLPHVDQRRAGGVRTRTAPTRQRLGRARPARSSPFAEPPAVDRY